MTNYLLVVTRSGFRHLPAKGTVETFSDYHSALTEYKRAVSYHPASDSRTAVVLLCRDNCTVTR